MSEGAKFEICVSNNNSDKDYGFIEEYFDRLPFKYFFQPEQVSIDCNMLNVINMASGEYLLLLGDDDYITASLTDMVIFVEKNKPDLLCLSGNHVDMSLNVISEHLPDLKDSKLSTLDKFEYLCYLLPFGSLLVKTSSYDMKAFTNFIGTYHAYASFWVTFLKMYGDGIPVSIVQYQPQIVALGASVKTYDRDFFDVVARGIPLYFNILKKSLCNEETLERLNKIIYDYNASLLSIKNTLLFISKGTERSALLELHKNNTMANKKLHIFLIKKLTVKFRVLLNLVFFIKKIMRKLSIK